MGLALSGDAFGASLAIGMKRMGVVEKIILAVIVGFFHAALSGIGMWTGFEMQSRLGAAVVNAGGVILLFAGLQMMLSFWRQDNHHRPMGLGMGLFAFSVSVDSIPAGFTIGLTELAPLMTSTVIGCCAGLFTFTGLMLSGLLTEKAGKAGEAAGGVFLVFLGCKWLFGS